MDTVYSKDLKLLSLQAVLLARFVVADGERRCLALILAEKMLCHTSRVTCLSARIDPTLECHLTQYRGAAASVY